MRSKRQTTMAKMARERLVRERRELKREKKQAAAAERSGKAPDSTGSADVEGVADVAAADGASPPVPPPLES